MYLKYKYKIHVLYLKYIFQIQVFQILPNTAQKVFHAVGLYIIKELV